jgi:TonB family protein
MKPHACRWFVIMLATLVFLPSLAAQDVIVGEPGWFQNDGAPDQPPQTKRGFQPEFPGELRDRNAGETGYVIVTRCLDASGQSLIMEGRSAYPWFERAVEAAMEDWQMRPARRGGQPVPSWFWIPVIFNSRDAAPDQPEATPRLLAVTPVVVPRAMLGKLRNNATAWGTVRLDAAGIPQKVALEPGNPVEFLPCVETALNRWRFAPARSGGRPVAAEFRVAFLFCPPMSPVPAKQTPPRVIRRSQVPPVYPVAMKSGGIKGEVLLAFIVDKEGVVRNPVVVRSNNPAFDQPAIEALLKWKFEPAQVDGQAVNTRMSQPMVFDINDGREAVTVESLVPKGQQPAPGDHAYDVAPKFLGVVDPVFPYALLRDDQRGRASVKLVVGPAGEVAHVEVADATRPEFGLALVAAAETFKFDPALKDGHPVEAILRIEQEFGSQAGNRIVSDDDLALLRIEKQKPESIVGANKLDAPLKPLSRRSPVFPLALRRTASRGEARIELLIDEKGHPRLPRIAAASDPAFGYAAVQAVAQWLFEPPISGGKPAVVRVIVPFVFAIKPAVMAPATDAAPAQVEPAAQGDAAAQGDNAQSQETTP